MESNERERIQTWQPHHEQKVNLEFPGQTYSDDNQRRIRTHPRPTSKRK